MVDFGRPAGDMYKSVYDTDDNGIVDQAETVLAHAPDHQYGGDDEVDATALAGRINYVDRGDPSAADYLVADLTTDGAFHDLDLSSIVPAGAKAVRFSIVLIDDLVAAVVLLRQKGNTNIYNIDRTGIQVANQAIVASPIVSCSTARIVEYLTTNTTFTYIGITIRGWFI